MKYDAIIAGGGSAGSTAACFLASASEGPRSSRDLSTSTGRPRFE